MKIFFIIAAFVWHCEKCAAQNLIQAEYFLDADAGFGKNNTITFASALPDASYNFNINLSGVSIGYHKLYIRIKDSNGNWGQTGKRNIQVISSNAIKTITAAEYFVDADPGFNSATPITVDPQAADLQQNFKAALSGLSIGYHKLYIRTKDNDGNWGITSKRNIEVASVNKSVNINRGEYFFDTDPGFNEATPVMVTPTDSVILQNFNTVTAALSAGYHKLYIRIKDNDQKWSITSRRNVEVVKAFTNMIAGAEYFFNTDPGIDVANPVTFSNPLADGGFSFKIPINAIQSGAHTLYIRARDSVNNWSITQWQQDSVVTSVQAGKWSQPATWSNNKVPGINTVVLLYHNVDVDIADAVCKSLTPYGNNVKCTVEAGKALKIAGRK